MLLYGLSPVIGDVGPAAMFIRGAADDDGDINLSDAIVVLQWQFLGGPEPGCLAAADVNGDGDINVPPACP